MTCGVDPGVVDWAGLASSLLISLLQNGKLLVETIFFIVDRHNGGQESQGTGLMRLADVIEVFVARQFSELTRDRSSSLMGVLTWILLLEKLDSHLLFKCFHLLWEHLQKSANHFAVEHLRHTLELEDSWSRVFFIDLKHALNGR